MEQKTEEKKYNVYKRKLKINNGYGLGRKFEKINEFGESYFRDNYYDAFAVTQKIIERNKKIKEKRNDERETCKKEFGQERLYNIVAFCGDRGAGKTSVMDSVVGALQSKSTDYKNFIAEYEKEEERESDLSRMLANYKFVCLEGIDASLLEGEEDILDVILSKMLQKLQRHIKSRERNYFENEMGYSYSQTDINRKFEEIYQNRRNLLWRMKNPYEPGESSTEHLSNLAGSLDIREKLQKLIPIYLQALQAGGEVDKQYLVINIDDLDMHGKAYQMLEQLHRYLMIPQVIIYIAVSEKEIGAVCERYFRETYDSPGELAMSYLEKVLPYSQRIYLPDVFSGDFFNIVAGSDPKLDIYLVKDYLLTKIAEKTWVFYDGKGLETHFYEIGNLRTLYNFYYLLEGMKKTGNASSLFREGEISEEQRGILDGNFEKLKNDVIGRMATEKLSSEEQRRIFKDYYREDFSTNGEYLLEQIISIIPDIAKECSDYGYSYGTLLYALYNLSKTRQDFKPLVQCVLAMATIELTQNYIYAFRTSELSSRIKWREYISGSICGNWGNRMLPAVKCKKNQDQCKPVAYVKNQKVCIEAVVDIKNDSIELDAAFEVFSELIEKYALVQSFELLMAFITKKNVIKKKEDISMECEKTGIYKIKSSKWECTFDFLGAIVNIADYEGVDRTDDKKYFKKVRDMLLGMLEKYAVDSGRTLSETQREELEKKMKDASLECAYTEWKLNYGRIALPLYSMDIMYNVLKRVKKKMNRELPQQIESEEFLTAIKQFYRALGEELLEENKFYNREAEGTKQNRTYFYEGFCYYPFIYPFMDLENCEDIEKESEKVKALKQKFPNKLPKLFEDLFTKLVQELVSCNDEGKSK